VSVRTAARRLVAAALALALYAAAVLAAAGCRAVAPGSDPVVVRAEQANATGIEAVDLFLKVEHDNRAWVRAELPAVHATAETIRREFPRKEEEYLDALALYRQTRARADADAAATKRAILDGLAAQARQALDRLNKRKAERKQ
jgi:hypothetical protein